MLSPQPDPALPVVVRVEMAEHGVARGLGDGRTCRGKVLVPLEREHRVPASPLEKEEKNRPRCAQFSFKRFGTDTRNYAN